MLLNKQRALAYMRQCGLDALVATSPVNVQYLTDYYWWIDPLSKEYMGNPGSSSELAHLYAVLTADGEASLVLNPLLAVNAADIWVTEIHTFGAASVERSTPPTFIPPNLNPFYELLNTAPRNATPLDAFVEILEQRGLKNARIGIELEGVSDARREAIQARVPNVVLLDCSNLLRIIRTVKSTKELERLKRAAEISEQAALTSMAQVRVGDTFTSVVNNYMGEIGHAGAEFDHFAYTPRGLGIATEPTYIFQADDVMYVDFGCLYRQYFSDSGLTLALREPSVEVERLYQILRECVGAAVEKANVGALVSTVQAAMMETLHSYGSLVSYPHGHSIGLEVRDYPILVAANQRRIHDDCIDVSSDLALEADMVINLEASFFRPGLDSLNLEQTFLITSDGCHPLIAQAREWPLIAGE